MTRIGILLLVLTTVTTCNLKCSSFSIVSSIASTVSKPSKDLQKLSTWRRRASSFDTVFYQPPTSPTPTPSPPHKYKRPPLNALTIILLAISIATTAPPPPALAASPPALEETETLGSSARKYWNIMQNGRVEQKVAANEALVDHAIGTVNTMYYDNSGGVAFQPRDFYNIWKDVRDTLSFGHSKYTTRQNIPDNINLDTRAGAVNSIRFMIATLNDPFSSYLTREELRQELQTRSDGFLGLGMIVEPPNRAQVPLPIFTTLPSKNKHLLSNTRVANLPIISAVVPDSPAERAGLVVGDRIVAIGTDTFWGATVDHVAKVLDTRYSADNYAGYPELTIAKPVWASSEARNGDVVVGYRPSHVRLTTTSLAPLREQINGNSIVHYELLTASDSILDQSSTRVGYIRLTRFSRAATTGYIKAVQDLEAAGAQSYIIDIRNNYGGVIQEAMLTASTLLRDPHAVLCYTMNSRGGFTPHDAEEYIVDSRYPGYLLSQESTNVARNQVKRESPGMFQGSEINWVPPSSYASLHEQKVKRGIHIGEEMRTVNNQLKLQKKLVLLVNEGTASSAEVFASSLHDNGRTVALVGTKTFGKGLIQHTFPMPDGGGLRLTVAEYLTPSLQHVTKVGGARFDQETGEFIGGGIRPDILCESKQGIPSNAGADLCVGVALDALQDAELEEESQNILQRVGGTNGGSGTRRAIVEGVVKDSF